MNIALSTVLVVSTLLIPAASAQDNSIDDSPEGVVRAAYSLVSFDPNRPIDREKLAGYFTDDAVVAFGPSLEDMAVMPLGTFFDEVEKRARAGEVGGDGHRFALVDVDCSPVGEVAMCFARYRLEVPDDDVEDYIGTRGVGLRRRDGRWLITDLTWVVNPPKGVKVEPTAEVGLLWLPTAGQGVQPTPERTWGRALPTIQISAGTTSESASSRPSGSRTSSSRCRRTGPGPTSILRTGWWRASTFRPESV